MGTIAIRTWAEEDPRGSGRWFAGVTIAGAGDVDGERRIGPVTERRAYGVASGLAALIRERLEARGRVVRVLPPAPRVRI